MRILIATDGTLDPSKVAKTVDRCHREGDTVTLFTALPVPVEFLHRLGSSGVKAAADIAHEAGHPMSSGDRAAERLAPPQPIREEPPTDSPVLSALASTAAARMKPIVDVLAARNIDCHAMWRTTENQTAKTIIQTIQTHDIDLLVIGSHGGGRFEGLLGSTSTKLVRMAPADVLVIRNPVHA
ncbi:MAG: universal stress protein [Acidimicrobiia bacterium]|nr:universal stress protein [Acidimicrobiia bacterium]